MGILFHNGFVMGAQPVNVGPIVNCSPSSIYNGNVYYDNVTTLTWSDDTSGYSLYSGGFNNVDDGYTNNPITIPSYFFMACTGSTKLYVSTNGYVSFEVGTSGNGFNGPQNAVPPMIAANPGDLYLNPGASISDGTTSNAWYKFTNDSNFMKVELKVFQTHFQNQSLAMSYQLNLYRDSTYQWIETFAKSNLNQDAYGGQNPVPCGPTSSTDVSQPSSIVSKVWRGELGGTTWTYMGEGSITTTPPISPIEVSTYFAPTSVDACSLAVSGLSVNITGDTADFTTSTSFTGNTFAAEASGTYYITYQGVYREITLTYGSNVVSVTAGFSNCPDTQITGGYYNSGVSVSSGYNPYGTGSSYLFNGSNGYITLTGNTDTAFGTGDFTVEWYQFENSHNAHPRIFAIGAYPSATLEVSEEGGSFYVMENAGWRASPSYGAILQNWVHFAIVRISGTTTIYKDGSSIYSYADSYDLNDSSTDLHIGQESPVSDAGAYFNGAITSFRWTKGLGIYTGNFQKPTGPLSFTASANPFGGSNTQAISAGYVKYLLQPGYSFLLNVGFDKNSYPNTSPITLYSNAPTLSAGMYLYTDPNLTTLYVPALNSNINDFNDGTHLIAVSQIHPQEDGLITAFI